MRERDMQVAVGLNNFIFSAVIEDLLKQPELTNQVQFEVKNLDCALYKDSLALMKVFYSFLLTDCAGNVTEMEMHGRIREHFEKPIDSFYVLILRNFDCLFQKKVLKFIYTFLELYSGMHSIFVLGLTCKYDFLAETDPRIVSRFPKKITFLEEFSLETLESFVEASVLLKPKLSEEAKKATVSFLKNKLYTDDKYKVQKMILNFAGFSFKAAVTTMRQFFFDLFFDIKYSKSTEMLEKIRFKIDFNNIKRYKTAAAFFEKTFPGEGQVVEEYKTNYFLLNSVINAASKINPEDEQLIQAAEEINSESSLTSEDLKQIIKKNFMNVIKYQEETIHFIFKGLTEHHLVVLTSFILAFKKVVSRISIEDIYVQYCSLIKPFGMIKLDMLNIGAMVKELVATNILFQYQDGKKVFYGLQGSQRVVLEALKTFVGLVKINEDFKTYVSKLELNF